MASTINRFSSDLYKIKINEGGEIVLDVGSSESNPGKITITGDLDVLGQTTAIASTELEITDSTITIGKQDPTDSTYTSGMALGEGGIIFDRGFIADAELFFIEDLYTYKNVKLPGSFVMQDSNSTVPADDDSSQLNLFGLYAAGLRPKDGDNLYLLGDNSSGLVTVTGTTDYEKQIFEYDPLGFPILEDVSKYDGLQINNSSYDDDALVNTKLLQDYVVSYHLYNYQNKISADYKGVIGADATETSVEVIDAGDGSTALVNVNIDTTTVATFYDNRLQLANINLTDQGEIYTRSLNGTLVLRGQSTGAGTGDVQIDDTLNLTKKLDPASPPADGVVLYSKTLADGGTGLYFLNEDGTNDEIISRNKALLYSIIF